MWLCLEVLGVCAFRAKIDIAPVADALVPFCPPISHGVWSISLVLRSFETFAKTSAEGEFVEDVLETLYL